ncbi:MAG: sigma-70 family RNA polymerase sigma factor [Chitinispirillaceae bacterium]|nr:sigma-70 family RNA polymerase sigma factor [Chitinispirillaceae bacterium]
MDTFITPVAAANETDAEVELARTGDRNAFNRLVIRYQDMIVSLCIHLLKNRTDAEDAAQETFVKSYQQLGSFRGDARFSTWLYTIAVNVCRNRQRSFWQKLFKRSVAVGIPGPDDDTTEMIEIIDSSPLPSQELEKKELRDQIKRAIDLLPHRYRELIILRDLRQLRYDEIAEIMNVPEGTIKSGIARARLALQAELRGMIDGF